MFPGSSPALGRSSPVNAKPAQAAPSSPTLNATSAASLAADLDSSGTYRDSRTGSMVVTVTSEAQAQRVRDAGGTAKIVQFSGSQLQAAFDVLNRDALIPGTAWSIDPTTNQVVVTTDETVTGGKLAALTAVTNRLGEKVRIETTPGEFSTRLAGGDAIYGGGARCSAGFNVTDGAYSYLLTAGHCGNIVDTWYADGGQSTLVGYVEGSSFPGDDYALVGYYNDIPRPGEVNLYNGSSQDITSAGNAYVGEQVRRSGSTTGVFGGQVQGLNATVNYQEGSVFGLIQTNVCAEGGDSGGTTFFQPVTEALSVYGMSIY
ncbi:MAG: alpha-lytic protease prodomain-containing protein [Geodermatophilaceae bacterium]|nr:alpha-lytic protease prodomain-containing protein [Geodermatophilaceae bacterium]